jgi:hypothetical protein
LGHLIRFLIAYRLLDPFISFSRRVGGGAVSALRIRSFPLALLQGTAEAVRLGSGFDDIRAVSDAVDQRFAEPGRWE